VVVGYVFFDKLPLPVPISQGDELGLPLFDPRFFAYAHDTALSCTPPVAEPPPPQTDANKREECPEVGPGVPPKIQRHCDPRFFAFAHDTALSCTLVKQEPGVEDDRF
jgi:hypothetical protein